MAKENFSKKQGKISLLSMEKDLQQAFGASAVKKVNIEMQLEESVSQFLSAMNKGKARVPKCKTAFGE
ncbi:MAG: hypothetical protein WC082_02615 [Victivallales bacterium]|jgi:hypothetical protein